MRALVGSLPPILVLAVLTVAFAAACGGGDDDATPTSSRQSPPPPAAAPQPTSAPAVVTQGPSGGEGGGTPVTIVNEDIGGSGAYAFNPSTMSFKVGETVTFTLAGETEFHTFTVEDLNIDESLEAGETRTVNYTFEKAGTFKIVCLAHPQMTGTITVR